MAGFIPRPTLARPRLRPVLENALLYPGVPVLERVNGAVRRGQLPSLLTWRYFWVEVVRHAAYGIVLGGLLRNGRRSG